MYRLRLSVEDLRRLTRAQRIAHELYRGDDGITQAELDQVIGAKSGKALAMRLYRLRKRLGIERPQARGKKRPAWFTNLGSMQI